MASSETGPWGWSWTDHSSLGSDWVFHGPPAAAPPPQSPSPSGAGSGSGSPGKEGSLSTESESTESESTESESTEYRLLTTDDKLSSY